MVDVDMNALMRFSLNVKDINIDKIKQHIEDNNTKRICFSCQHKNALRIAPEGENWYGCLNIPFSESIETFIDKECALKVKYVPSKGKYWCPANDKEQYEKLSLFFEKYKETIFLRDCLDNSIALSEYVSEDNIKTTIGELEHEAKYNNCQESLKLLSEHIQNFINGTSVYNDIPLVCSIPSSKEDELNLPQKIVHEVATNLQKRDISSFVKWKNPKPKLKRLELNKKLEALEQADIDINIDIKEKDIILIDDLYQSGLTMQYVAMKLKDAGARRIFGITIVKSRKDSDNND